VEERRFKRRVTPRLKRRVLAPVAPLGLKADTCGVRNAALKGRSFAVRAARLVWGMQARAGC
jgi:hypothetical protein